MGSAVRRFLGIDASLTDTGLALIDGGAVVLSSIPTRKEDNIRVRMMAVVEKIERVLRPADVVTVEDFSVVGKMSLSAKSIERIQLLGMILQLVVSHTGNFPVMIHPARLKMFVSGNGRATKKDMIRELCATYGVVTTNHNAADAAGLALMGYYLVNGADAELVLGGKSWRVPDDERRRALMKEMEANERWLWKLRFLS